MTALAVDYGDSRLPDRFWDKVYPEPNTGCWLWGAYVQRTGYGWFRHDGESQNTHRIAYAALVAAIPTGLWIDHVCRVRACCNPAHLELVTPRENSVRGIQGGFGRSRTHCPQMHEYVGVNVRMHSNGRRVCRTCDNAASAARMRALKARRRAERAAPVGAS